MSARKSPRRPKPVDFERLVTDLVDAIAHVECALGYIENEDDNGPQSNVLTHAVRMLWKIHDLLDEHRS